MTPEQFQEKWQDATLTEKSASQSHFNDVCELLGVPKPVEADKHGTSYAFEKPTTRADKDGKAFADVWKKDCFVWEYKGNRRSLKDAYAQARMYAGELGNPPLLVVSDMKEIQVHTNFTGLVTKTTTFQLRDLVDPAVRRRLHEVFAKPEAWRHGETRESVTRDAAAQFGRIAQRLRNAGHDPQRVAHFLNRIVFCLFAEDIDLLPERVFAAILESGVKNQDQFAPMLKDLFRAMRKKNGRFGTVTIPWFNGGLFEDDEVLDLGLLEIRALLEASKQDWKNIEPSIFGTLFERGLDPEKRKAMAGLFDAPERPARQRGLFEKDAPDKGVGIHYTDPATIMKIVEPVVLAPLRREWEAVKAEVKAQRAAKAKAKSPAARTRAENAARDACMKFRDRLGRFRVLDPACGSGNFLYLALKHLKDFDAAVLKEAAALGLPLDGERVTPDLVLGIEINPYAAEIARVTIWIGELQWQMENGGGVSRSPILGQLDQIECRDALLAPDGTEAKWPKASVIVGNPPFLGDKFMRDRLGRDYTERLRAAYEDAVPGGADLVCYWFEKSRVAILELGTERAGLVATNSIRGGVNRSVLDRISETISIFDAWSDQPWVLDGAAVRVSLICFSKLNDAARLNGAPVGGINSSLTSDIVDNKSVKPLLTNEAVAFNGISKKGKFDIEGRLARAWLQLPSNPNGRRNSDVVRPWINGIDVTRRLQDMWIIHFQEMNDQEAAMYEAPYAWVKQSVFPERAQSNSAQERRDWWLLARRAPAMNKKIQSLKRYLVTPEVAKHRVFVWVPTQVVPDKNVIVIARDDDTAFGILQSRFHERWALRFGTALEDRPRYTSSSTFRTFPFPEGLTPNIPAKKYANDGRAVAIARAAKKLDELREAWLNPPDLVKRVPEVVPGYPDRILPKNDKAAEELKKRTLTNLYNQRPAWLDNAHKELDAAVAAAYGWPAGISDDDALGKLFALNQERAKKQAQAQAKPAQPAKPAQLSKPEKAARR